VEAWWKDAVRASKGRPHQVGKIIFTRDHGDTDEATGRGPVLCIDGQQRCTTSFLLLAALRDAALLLQRQNPGDTIGLDLIHNLNSLLYTDVEAAAAWVKNATASGAAPAALDLQSTGPGSFMRLVPSWVDRKHFYESVLGGLLQEAQPEWVPSETTVGSHQGQAKTGFDVLAAEAIAAHDSTENKLLLLRHMGENSMRGMALMYVEVLNEINMTALFLWMQDSSVMNIMFNPQPGIHMTGVDMVRNLVMSSYMDLPLSEQERHYFALWLEPLELRCAGVEHMEVLLEAFIESKTGIGLMETEDGGVGKPTLKAKRPRTLKAPVLHPSISSISEECGSSAASDAGAKRLQERNGKKRKRHVCATEKAIYGAAQLFAAKLPKEVPRLKGGMLYARFRSLVEETEKSLRAAQMCPPLKTAPTLILSAPVVDAFGNPIFSTAELHAQSGESVATGPNEEDLVVAQAAREQLLSGLVAFTPAAACRRI